VILLDTNVLLYAFGGDHRYRAPCAAIVDALARSQIAAAITDVVLCEFVYATARREPRATSAARAHDVLTAVTEVVRSDPDIRRQAVDLYETHADLQINDAMIAATSMICQLPLVSADRAFGNVPGLRYFAPDDPSVLERDLR
jgi:uncharacterized protein